MLFEAFIIAVVVIVAVGCWSCCCCCCGRCCCIPFGAVSRERLAFGLCCFVAILSVQGNALLLPRLNLSSRAKVETTEKLGEAIRAKNTEYSGQIGSRLVLFFSQAERSACVFLNSDVTRERAKRRPRRQAFEKVESQNASWRKKQRFWHKKKQTSSMQRPHHHRVVVGVVLIIKLSCYHQRKSWLISLTSRYNFFIKLIIY